MTAVENRIFAFRVAINMTENGLVPEVSLYDSAVDIGPREIEALENALKDAAKNWLEL